MVRNQKGFTLIELVVVIVILGILAAVAFPKFQDLSGSAQQAVVDSTGAAVKSAAVILFAKNSGSTSTTAVCTAATNLDYDVTRITLNTAAAPTVVVSYTGSSPLKSTSVNLTGYCT